MDSWDPENDRRRVECVHVGPCEIRQGENWLRRSHRVPHSARNERDPDEADRREGCECSVRGGAGNNRLLQVIVGDQERCEERAEHIDASHIPRSSRDLYKV